MDKTNGVADTERGVLAQLSQVKEILEQRVGLHSAWNGEVLWDTESSYPGRKDWRCAIWLHKDLLGSEPTLQFHTMLHESFHAISPGFSPSVYMGNRGWEEGVVEWWARHLERAVADSLGIILDLRKIGEVHRNTPYNKDVEMLQVIGNALEVEEEIFFGNLLRLPNDMRDRHIYDMMIQQRLRARDFDLWYRVGEARSYLTR